MQTMHNYAGCCSISVGLKGLESSSLEATSGVKFAGISESDDKLCQLI